jgi:hypothetical protein
LTRINEKVSKGERERRRGRRESVESGRQDSVKTSFTGNSALSGVREKRKILREDEPALMARISSPLPMVMIASTGDGSERR